MRAKKLFFWGGLISLILGLCAVAPVVLVYSNNQSVIKVLTDFVANAYNYSEADALIYIKVYLLAFAITNTAVGISMLVFCKKANYILTNKRIWVHILILANIFLGGNIITFIILLVAMFTVVPEKDVQKQQLSSELPKHVAEVKQKIDLIKKMKQDGAITQTEYEKLLIDILNFE